MNLPAAITALPDPATAEEVAAALRCSRRYVLREIAAGALPAVKHGGRWVVARADVVAYHGEKAAQCRAEIVGRISGGDAIGNSGSSGGTTAGPAARAQRALDAARKLQRMRPSRDSSSTGKPPADVIPLRA